MAKQKNGKEDKFKLAQGSTREINIESIISAPLVAASKANAFMLSGQFRFLINNCFKKNDRDNYEPEMISMKLQRTVINTDKKKGEGDFLQQELVFNVPIICLMPFSSLAVKDVSVDFNLEIISVTSYESNYEVLDRQVQLKGRVGRDPADAENFKRDSTNTSNLKVKLNAGLIPLPPGLLNVIELYNKSIQPVVPESAASNNNTP